MKVSADLISKLSAEVGEVAKLSRAYRSHQCGELALQHCGQEVVICGWVHRLRNMGKLVMLEVRDRYGVVQIRCEEALNAELYEQVRSVSREMVVQVYGEVVARPEAARRVDIPTGEIEVVVSWLKPLSGYLDALPYLFDAQVDTKEELRLKYRYLELRHPERQRVLKLRSAAAHRLRGFLTRRDFLEIETPMLYKPTPEGARDFLVPARHHPHSMYALPQSPQMLKQLLMIAGYDRYYQIIKCFRDEDLRADRQPEFTQVDLEASFVTESTMRELAHELCGEFFENSGLAMPQLAYDEASELFGTDKPDLRYGLPLVNLTAQVANVDVPVMKQLFQSNSSGCSPRVYGVYLPQSLISYSRKDIEGLKAKLARDTAQDDLLFFYVKAVDYKLQSGIAKWFVESQDRRFRELWQKSCQAVTGLVSSCPSLQDTRGAGVWLVVAHRRSKHAHQLGDMLRRELAQHCGLIDDHDKIALAWIHSFPLFEKDEELGTVVAAHHPFTMPHRDHLEAFMSLPPDAMHNLAAEEFALVSQSYDVVCNGFELASGSLRIYQPSVQRKAFELLGMSAAQIEQRYGFFLEALRLGAPPHGGIAFGFDRMMMLLTQCQQLRDVIAFPKTTSGACLMSGAPHQITDDELRSYGMSLLKS